MPHPLDGARVKIVRAQEHMDALRQAVARYVESNVYEITVQKNAEISTRGIEIADLDPKVSLIVGDCLVPQVRVRPLDANLGLIAGAHVSRSPYTLSRVARSSAA